MVEDQTAFQQLRWAIQALAADADEQLGLFPSFVDKPHELVDDFDNWWRATRWRESLGLSPAQVGALDAVQRLVDALPPVVYTELAVRTDQRWSELRIAARSVARLFGWPPDLPPSGRSAYVEGS